MAKITLTDVTAGYDTATISAANNTLIEDAIENTLSRDGTSPNQMESGLDMNSYRITNLPTAANSSEPVTLGQAASILDTTTATRENLGSTIWPTTSDETAAGVTPTKYYYEPGDVRRYGATGDGVTDDTTAIQSALDSNDYVYLQPDTYGISGQLVIPAFTTLDGRSWGGSQSVLYQLDSSNTTEALIVSKGWSDDNTVADGPVVLKNFFINGNSANNSGATTHGIELMTYQSLINNVQVFDVTGDGIRFTDQNSANSTITGTAVENFVTHCRITNVDGSGIYMEDHGNIISDSQIKDNVVGSVDEYGILSEAGGKVQNNHVYNTGFDGVAGQDGFNNIISGNSVQDWGQSATTGTRYGCVVYGVLDDNPCSINGNQVEISTVIGGSTYYAFGATFGAGVTTGVVDVIGNTAQLNGSEGVLQATGSGTGTVNLLSNTVQNAGSTLITPNSNVVIHSNNTFDITFQNLQSNGTPPVSQGCNFQTGAGTVTMTDLDDGYNGQVVTILFKHSGWTIDFTASGLKGNGATDWSPAIGDYMTCTYDGTDWYCDVVSTTAGSAYTETNVSTDRAFDADTVAVAELADVVGTLIVDLRAKGIIA